MIKYKLDNLFIRNPFKEVKMEEFNAEMQLPPIETIALKIHTDSAVEARFREKMIRAEEARQASQANPEEQFTTDRGRKRGFLSPLNNANKNIPL